jgi:hypothetical protein
MRAAPAFELAVKWNGGSPSKVTSPVLFPFPSVRTSGGRKYQYRVVLVDYRVAVMMSAVRQLLSLSAAMRTALAAERFH